MAKKFFDTVAFPDNMHEPRRIRGSHITSMCVVRRCFADIPAIYVVIAEVRNKEHLVHIADSNSDAVHWMKENFK
jgi:hypothetical protein